MKGVTAARWVAVDWGTTNLRAWVIGHGGEILTRHSSDRGMAQLSPDGYEPVLLEMLANFLRPDAALPVLICGMAGARQGWAEAPYLPVPCLPPTAAQAVRPNVADPRLAVHILPGLCQDKPADVMRGEETQLAGLLAQEPDFEGVVCLPGTHTKWVRVRTGKIAHFQTFMTGELFNLLARHSVLRHGIAEDGWDDQAFATALADAALQPQELTARLFSLRAEGLLFGLSPTAARARLSGLLIGVELAALRSYWLKYNIVVIGATRLADLYREALAQEKIAARQLDAEALTLSGLTAAFEPSEELKT